MTTMNGLMRRAVTMSKKKNKKSKNLVDTSPKTHKRKHLKPSEIKRFDEFNKRLNELSLPRDPRGREDLTPEQTEERLKNLILYISKQSENDPNFSTEKLGMLLYLIDTRVYRETGKSLTGSVYIKKENLDVIQTSNESERSEESDNQTGNKSD
jgi:hypothetical protein